MRLKNKIKDIIIRFVKAIIVTLLPIFFKIALDKWRNSGETFTTRDFKLLCGASFLLILDGIIIVIFEIYEHKKKEREHINEINQYQGLIEDYKNREESDLKTIEENRTKISELKSIISEKEITIEKQKEQIESQTIELSANDDRIKAQSNEIKVINNQSKDPVFELVDQIICDASNELYENIKRIRNDEHSETVDWKIIEKNCDKVCKYLHDYIKTIAERGDAFSVSVIFKAKKNGEEGYYMPSRSSSDNHKPKTLKNFVPKTEFSNYCFSELLENESTKHKICMNEDSIKAAFENYKSHYSQYIGIPVYCTGSKKFALLQIIAYDDSLISDKFKLVEHLTTNIFIPIANLVLLVNKTENVIQLLNGISPKLNNEKTTKRFNGFFGR